LKIYRSLTSIALSKTGRYNVRAFTRNSTSSNAKLLASLPNVSLFLGSAQSEPDLRNAFIGVDLAFVNTNSFALGIKGETHWGIRIFELAIQAGVKHYIWSNLDNVLRDSGYDESVNAGHYSGKSRVAQWMEAQPQEPMAWSLLTTGPYVETLSEALRPTKDVDGTYVFRAPLEDGAVPIISLDDIGSYALWIFDTPSESAGLDLAVSTETITWTHLAEIFSKVTGKKARYESLSIDDYFSAAGEAADAKLGADYSGESDDTLLTVKENFSRWWRIYQRTGEGKPLCKRDYALLDRILPTRIKSVEEWMVKTEYTGDLLSVLKNPVI
jgi:uncharacterized protein YbjT (DUF2867 family)